MLTFNVKKIWFDKIKSGEKTHEYRKMSDYWFFKLVPKDFFYSVTGNLNIPITDKTEYCQFRMGYPPTKKNPEKAKDKVLRAKVLKIIANVDGQTTDYKLIDPNVEDVFDIEFEILEE